MKSLFAVVTLALVFISVPAFAQNSGAVVYDFEVDNLNGKSLKPLEDNVGGNVHGKRDSLIKVRSDFIVELLKSTDDI